MKNLSNSNVLVYGTQGKAISKLPSHYDLYGAATVFNYGVLLVSPRCHSSEAPEQSAACQSRRPLLFPKRGHAI